MSPRPDTDEVLDIIEEETGLDWTVNTDEPDKISLAAANYKFELVWDGNCWTYKLYDLASNLGEEEPFWAQGPMYNATEVKKELPNFIPTEIRNH